MSDKKVKVTRLCGRTKSVKELGEQAIKPGLFVFEVAITGGRFKESFVRLFLFMFYFILI